MGPGANARPHEIQSDDTYEGNVWIGLAHTDHIDHKSIHPDEEHVLIDLVRESRGKEEEGERVDSPLNEETTHTHIYILHCIYTL